MKVRKTTIKKPKFLFLYFICLTVMLIAFSVIGLLIYLPAFYAYEMSIQEEGIHNEENLLTTIRLITNKEELSDKDMSQIKDILIRNYSLTGRRYKTCIADFEEIDSSQTAILVYYENGKEISFLQLADEKYLEFFNSPEVIAWGFYESNPLYDHLPKELQINFDCKEFYADFDKGLFIPVEVEILDEKEMPTGVTKTFEPDNTNGYTLIKPDPIYPLTDLHVLGTVAGYIGIDKAEDYTYIDQFRSFFFHKVEFSSTPLNGTPFNNVYKENIRMGMIMIICAALASALIPSTIIYYSKKRKYEIFEFRRQLVDAMAHDLKTPMAAIAAYSENLSNNIATDKKEYYAGKIQEKISQMNKMVNDILEFSKSENSAPVINKEDIDIKTMIARILTDNEHIIAMRSLKINYDKKKVIIKTDTKLFQQAISNLINNAVLYSKEGTTIDISCNDKELRISNISNVKISNTNELSNPFTKGSISRGNIGTGLGLAIADNNLSMLGYKMNTKYENDIFKVQILL